MTTSRRTRKGPEELPPESDVPQGAVAAGDATTGGTEPPQDEQQLREEIVRTREELGQTVEQLAAKTDVKARVRAKAAQLTGRAKRKTNEVRAKAADRGAGVRAQVAGKTVMARQKAVAVGGTVKSRVQAKAAPVWASTPEPVRRGLAKGASTARQRRVPLAVAAATLAAGFVALRWWRKR